MNIIEEQILYCENNIKQKEKQKEKLKDEILQRLRVIQEYNEKIEQQNLLIEQLRK